MNKKCEICNNVFYKKQSESKKYWERKRFCSKQCSTIYDKSPEKSEKIKKWMKWNKNGIGHSVSEESIERIRNMNKGKIMSKETRKKLSIAHKWKKNKEYKEWSESEYTLNWTQTLKRSIRERDWYMCQMPWCNKPQRDIAHSVHHIDYNKSNCNPENLITLCNVCHAKTNYKREIWIEYFKNLLKLKTVQS